MTSPQHVIARAQTFNIYRHTACTYATWLLPSLAAIDLCLRHSIDAAVVQRWQTVAAMAVVAALQRWQCCSGDSVAEMVVVQRWRCYSQSGSWYCAVVAVLQQ